MQFCARHKLRNLRQRHPNAFQRLGLIAFQLTGAQLLGQYHPVAVAQVAGGQGQFTQLAEFSGLQPDFFT
ncbi:hypothetical protein D9M73_296950 [compost metagenome]